MAEFPEDYQSDDASGFGPPEDSVEDDAGQESLLEIAVEASPAPQQITKRPPVSGPLGRSNAGVIPVTPAVPFPQTNQLQFLSRVVMKELWAHKWSFPFQQPVDDVKLGIPDYYQIVTKPMDLGSIKNRLRSGYYEKAAACIADIELTFQNCYLYNKPNDDVYRMGQELDRLFHERLSGLPQPEMQARRYVPPPTKKSSRTAAVTARSLSAPELHAPPEKHTSSPLAHHPPETAATIATASPAPAAHSSHASHAATANAAPTTTPSGGNSKKERRISSRPVKVPSKDLPDSGRKKPGGKQLRFCQTVIRELFHKRHAAYAWPFLEPVNAEALGLHDYHTIIKKPMDLGTVRDKLEKGAYRNGTDFANDVRLIFTNCYKYNPPEHDVVAMCKKLQQTFEYHMAQMPEEDIVESESSESESEDDAQKHISKLQKTLETLQKEMLDVLSGKINKKKRKHKEDKPSTPKPTTTHKKETPRPRPAAPTGPAPAAAAAPAQPSPVAPASAPRAPVGRRPAVPKQQPQHVEHFSDEEEEFSYDDKRQLSLDIQRLPGDRLPRIAEIVQAHEPNLDMGSSEFEIDFDQLSSRTMRALRSYVDDCLSEKPAPKKRKPAASSVGRQKKATAPATASAIAPAPSAPAPPTTTPAAATVSATTAMGPAASVPPPASAYGPFSDSAVTEPANGHGEMMDQDDGMSVSESEDESLGSVARAVSAPASAPSSIARPSVAATAATSAGAFGTMTTAAVAPAPVPAPVSTAPAVSTATAGAAVAEGPAPAPAPAPVAAPTVTAVAPTTATEAATVAAAPVTAVTAATTNGESHHGISFDVRQESLDTVDAPPTEVAPAPAPAKPVIIMNHSAWAAMSSQIDASEATASSAPADADVARFQRQRQEQLDRERVAQEQRREREAREAARRAEEQREQATAAAAAAAERQRQRELERASLETAEAEVDLTAQSRAMNNFDELLA
eukprot:m.16627 g.16627  ORF g.16627 m.16627 type:complete len:964 (-) comp6946_c0_seq1:351-3242(-)